MYSKYTEMYVYSQTHIYPFTHMQNLSLDLTGSFLPTAVLARVIPFQYPIIFVFIVQVLYTCRRVLPVSYAASQSWLSCRLTLHLQDIPYNPMPVMQNCNILNGMGGGGTNNGLKLSPLSNVKSYKLPQNVTDNKGPMSSGGR